MISTEPRGLARSASHPTIAMCVANSVTDDTRVLRAATSASAAGFDVSVIGLSPSGQRRDERYENFRLIRVPLAPGNRPLARAQRSLAPGWRSLLEAIPALGRIERRFAVAEALQRGEALPRLKRRIARTLPSRRRVAWNRAFPVIAALEPRCRRELTQLSPQLIHAHDFTGLGLAGPAALQMRAAGRPVSLLYDAHEYVRGLTDFPPDRLRAAILLENAFIRAADGIITVSPELAALLESTHRLPTRPQVVLNTPWRERIPSAPRTVRGVLDLPTDVPLLVYPGNAKPIRGLETVVKALPDLENAHAALITNRSPYLDVLRELAASIGCSDRLHFLPYVRPAEVASFIRDATVGLNPILRYGNSDVVLPNKVFEFLHADLPMVVSDVRTASAFVRRLGVGEVYAAGDPGGLVAATRRVLRSPKSYKLSGEAREAALAEYSWERQAERLISTYRALLPPDSGQH